VNAKKSKVQRKKLSKIAAYIFVGLATGLVLGMAFGVIMIILQRFSLQQALIAMGIGAPSGIIIGLVAYKVSRSEKIWNPSPRQAVTRMVIVMALVVGLVVGWWVQYLTHWPRYSLLIVGAIVALVLGRFASLIIHEDGDRTLPEGREAPTVIEEYNHVPKWLLKRYYPLLIVDDKYPDNSETEVRFAGRLHWTQQVNDTTIDMIVMLVAGWLVFGRPGTVWIRDLVIHNPWKSLIALGALVAFSVALAMKKKLRLKLKTKKPWIPAVIGFILMWALIGTPGAGLLLKAFGPTGSVVFWSIVAAIAGMRAYWNSTDRTHTVFMLTNIYLRIVKRGPILIPWMPARSEMVPIDKINIVLPIETSAGKATGRAGVTVSVPAETKEHGETFSIDAAFERMYPLRKGEHSELIQQLNLMMQRNASGSRGLQLDEPEDDAGKVQEAEQKA